MAGVDSYTKLMLHMDGANDSITFVDSSLSPKAVTQYTDAKITTTESVFGGSSALFPIAGVGYLSVADSDDWYFGTDDFTIDFRIKRFVNNYTRHVWAQYIDGSNQIRLYIDSTTNKLIFYVGYAGTPIAYFVSNDAVLAATDLDWHHFALVRNGTSPGCLKAYKDGILIPITTTNDLANASMPNLASVARIGSRSGTDYFSGYLDELRISKGIARWTSNFTPPSTSYNNDIIVTIPTCVLTTVGTIDTIGCLPLDFLSLDTASIAISSTASTRLIKTNQFAVTYRCVLTGSSNGLSDVIIPISSFQVRKRVV